MPLRQVQVFCPEESIGRLRDYLVKDGVGAWASANLAAGDEDTGEAGVFILMEAYEVDDFLQALSEQFPGQKDLRVFVFALEATYPDLPEPEKSEEEEEEKSGESIAMEELREKIRGGAQISISTAALVILSTLVASVGLIKSSVEVIIGAMVIAPLLGPNMALAFGTTMGDWKLIGRSLVANMIGAGTAFGLAFVTGTVFTVDPGVDTIASRTVVSYGDILLALAAGSAGALAYTTGVSAALVGVMVAVALLPPLAAAGLLIGAGEFVLGSKAALLVAVNIVSINFAAMMTFLVQGFRPRRIWDVLQARKFIRSAAAIWIVLLGILAFLIWLTVR